jgi:hypothetical protein
MGYTGGGWIRPKRRWALYLRDDLACVYCRREVAHVLLAGDFLTLDHLRLKGSGNGWRDVITACSTCNCLRHKEPWRGFAASMPDGPVQVIARVRRQVRRSERKFLTAAVKLLADPPPWLRFNNAAVQAHFNPPRIAEPEYWPDEDRWEDPGAGHSLVDEYFPYTVDPDVGF